MFEHDKRLHDRRLPLSSPSEHDLRDLLHRDNRDSLSTQQRHSPDVAAQHGRWRHRDLNSSRRHRDLNSSRRHRDLKCLPCQQRMREPISDSHRHKHSCKCPPRI